MIKRKLLIQSMLTLTVGMLLHTSVQAQEFDTRPNVYTGANYQLFDNEVNQEDDLGWLFGAEVPVAERWGVNLEHWLVESDNENAPGDAELKYTRLGANYHLAPQSQWQPYVGVGLGYYRLKEAGLVKDIDESAFDFGVGVKRFIGDNFFLRGDVKFIRVDEINTWDQAVSLSIGYAFGPRSSRPAAPVAAAPAAAPAPAAPADPDSDGDGVADSRDRCANTPRNLAVDANGCPILDRSQERQELLVQFDFDQAVVKPEFYDEIATFAEFLTTYSNTNAVIEGHTDSDGTEAYNQGLSERRATAVMNRLVSEHRIAASRLSAVGYGEARPVVENTSAANKQRNRRIEAEVSVQVETQRPR
jgi:OOP family OmpA-OmpF porin